jgi:hypothetical protein
MMEVVISIDKVRRKKAHRGSTRGSVQDCWKAKPGERQEEKGRCAGQEAKEKTRTMAAKQFNAD